MQIKTKVGMIKGYQENNLYLFKGIPYAKAKRFEAPQPITWEDVFDASQFSKKAPQIRKGEINLDEISEDCLTLNIYTPNLNAQLPVLIEIHGGAFQTGSNQGMDPFQVIQNDSFVYVNINYRLGVLGYLYQDNYPTSGNNGTLDQLAAIEWVKNNIEYFGGNSEQITVLGSSAGAKAIGALLSTNKMQELVSQVILISGAYQSVRSIKTAKKVTERYYDIIGTTDLENCSLKQLLETQKELCQGQSTCILGPVSDDIVIDKNFYENYHLGRYWKGKVLLGSSLHELMFYQMNPNFTSEFETICRELFGEKYPIALKEAELLKEKMKDTDAYIKILSDGMYRTYTYKMAQHLKNQGCTVYQYSTHLSPACHVLDHLLALNVPSKYKAFFKEEHLFNQAIEIGKQIRQSYVDFICYGKPNWPSLNETNQQMIFDETPYLKEIDLSEVCSLFEDAVYE